MKNILESNDHFDVVDSKTTELNRGNTFRLLFSQN